MAVPSPFFARIKRDVRAIVAAVPHGRLVTFKDVGTHLDVMPRHVAYILARLDPAEAVGLPWFRAVPEDGRLATPKHAPDGQSQRELLAGEGHRIAPDGRILDLGQRVVAVADLPHNVPVQTRPADAPRTSTRGKRAPQTARQRGMGRAKTHQGGAF
jgi:methylated-DNA-protein-cysteine methyltransferase related protein